MKLTRIHLYTLNYREPAARPEDVILWAASPEEAVARFVTDHPVTGSDLAVHITGPEVDATYRVDPEPKADLFTSGSWVVGQPPLDGQHYLVKLQSRKPQFSFAVVTRSTRPSLGVYEAAGCYCDTADITHYDPTPVIFEAS